MTEHILNSSIGDRLQNKILSWNESQKHTVIGPLGARVLGAPAILAARVADLAIQILAALIKIPTGLVRIPANCILHYCKKPGISANWSLTAAVTHLGRAILFLGYSMVDPLVNAINPSIYRTYHPKLEKDYSLQIAALHSEIDSLEEQLQSKQNLDVEEQKKLENKITALKASLVRLGEEKATAQASIKDAKQAERNSKAEKNRLDRETNVLKGEKQTLKSQKETLEQEKIVLEGEIVSLQADKDAKEGELDTITARVASLGEAAKIQEVAELDQRIARKKLELSALDEEIKQRRQTRDRASRALPPPPTVEENKQLKDRIKKLEELVEQLTKEKTNPPPPPPPPPPDSDAASKPDCSKLFEQIKELKSCDYRSNTHERLLNLLYDLKERTLQKKDCKKRAEGVLEEVETQITAIKALQNFLASYTDKTVPIDSLKMCAEQATGVEQDSASSLFFSSEEVKVKSHKSLLKERLQLFESLKTQIEQYLARYDANKSDTEALTDALLSAINQRREKVDDTASSDSDGDDW